jgi:threonine synthase
LKQSGGTAIAVSDDDLMQALREWSRDEGIFAAPEGAASLAAYRALLKNGFLSSDEQVVLFNTGTGLKYMDEVAGTLGMSTGAATPKPQPRNIGGIIGPY